MFRSVIKSLSVVDDEAEDEDLVDRDVVVDDVNAGAAVTNDKTGKQCLGSTTLPAEELVTVHLLANFRHTEDNMVGMVEKERDKCVLVFFYLFIVDCGR